MENFISYFPHLLSILNIFNYIFYVLIIFLLDMAEACCLRNTKEIQKSIDMAREANFDHHLDMQIALSLKILNRVKEIERITKPLLKMNQKMLTEMKKYQKPPNGVHQVLRATCLLLGDDPKHLRVTYNF